MRKFATASFFGAALMLALCFGTMSAMAEESVNVCSGSKGLNYYKFVDALAKQAANVEVQINVLETKGSGDNAERLKKGDCVAGPMQPEFGDQLGIKPAFVLWDEYAHLICRRDMIPSGATDIDDLIDSPNLIAIGGTAKGSGNRLTWETWAEEDSSFGSTNFALMDLGTAKSIQMMTNEPAGVPCTFFVSGLNSDYMSLLNAPGASNKYVFIEMNDSDQDDYWAYDHVSLDDNVYPNLMDGNTTTVAVESGFYISDGLDSTNPTVFAAMLTMGQTIAGEMRSKMVND